AYRTAADGTTNELHGDVCTPYATVIPFRAEQTFGIDDPLDRARFERRLAGILPLTNRIWALRIHGHFSSVTTGASRRQHPPYRPLAEVLPTYHNLTHTDTTGTLIAFHCPVYLAGVDIHYHWLSDERGQGGPVTDFRLTRTSIQACEATGFTVDLPTTPQFRELDLTPFHPGRTNDDAADVR
ncbi:MAG: acetolactate decarboxylase, partial [Pseudonocardiaceae bacterium]